MTRSEQILSLLGDVSGYNKIVGAARVIEGDLRFLGDAMLKGLEIDLHATSYNEKNYHEMPLTYHPLEYRVIESPLEFMEVAIETEPKFFIGTEGNVDHITISFKKDELSLDRLGEIVGKLKEMITEEI